jgi:hypothetical protein
MARFSSRKNRDVSKKIHISLSKLQMIQINASDFAKYSGHNPYASGEEQEECFWRSNARLASRVGRAPSERLSCVEKAVRECSGVDVDSMRNNLSLPSNASAADISRAIQTQVVTPAVAQNTTAQLSTVLAASSKTVLAGFPAAAAASVVESIERDTQIQRGRVRERSSLDLLEGEAGRRIVNRNDRCLRKTLFHIDGAPVTLLGRVDGRLETTGEVVEAKERRNRLFGRVVDYEKVQMHCYMHLTQTLRSVLRERHDEETRDHIVAFDEEFWVDAVERVKHFVSEQMAPYKARLLEV